jgi:hypothetical protein
LQEGNRENALASLDALKKSVVDFIKVLGAFSKPEVETIDVGQFLRGVAIREWLTDQLDVAQDVRTSIRWPR